MKLLTILIVTIVYQSHSANSSAFLDIMSSKLNQIANTFASTFIEFKNRVKHFLYSQIADPNQIEEYKPIILDQSMIEQKIMKAFNDFVEKTAAESETESPEFLNLRSEPTALMSTPQLATLHGRRVESHVIQTKDGYLLTLHRITTTANQNTTKFVNQTVILHHGLLGSSADWILLGAKTSLPYLLSNIGYDVWMSNARGNYYSRGHVSKKVDSHDYWKFSWQEIGEYDLPATIDYIRRFKNMTEPINYIGHSMGATALLVLLAEWPDYSKYLRMAVLLAPLAFMTNIEGPMKVFTSMASRPPEQLLKIIGSDEFLPSRKVPKLLAYKYCKGLQIFCKNPLLFLSGGIPPQNISHDESFVARLLYHVPAGGSTNTILHYGQLIHSGKFHKFDDELAEYPLAKITLPIVLFSSSDDWLAASPDVLRLYFSIANPIDHYVIRGRNISHADFIWGDEAPELVFGKIIEYMQDGPNWNHIKTNEVWAYQ